MIRSSSTSSTVPRRKAVLFCPECRHESPVTGDWIVDDGDYTCPDCGVTIASRAAVRRVPVC